MPIRLTANYLPQIGLTEPLTLPARTRPAPPPPSGTSSHP
jgi:hypothetical protein